MEIDSHLGCAMSGLTADARTMVDHARVTSQMHAFTYDEPIGVESCTQAVCDLALRFGESVEDDDALMVGLFVDLSLLHSIEVYRCLVGERQNRRMFGMRRIMEPES